MSILDLAIGTALSMLSAALLLNLWRALRGPDMPDRILALDTLYTNSIALLVLLGIQFHNMLYFASALLLALLGFLATAALGRYLLRGNLIEAKRSE
jgi:multicomponent K+:H+ antiporter subunit F